MPDAERRYEISTLNSCASFVADGRVWWNAMWHVSEPGRVEQACWRGRPVPSSGGRKG